MEYKLIALDLDDTLLNAKKEVTPGTRRAIQRAVEAGVHVVLASGRTFPGMRFVLDDLGHADYTISSGGAVVTDPHRNPVFTCPVPAESAKKVMRYAAESGIYFQVFSGSDFYYLERTQKTANYEANVKFTGIHDPGLLNRDVGPLSKILIMDSPEKVSELRAQINRLFPDVQTVFSQIGYLEILNADVSKGKALWFIAQILDLTPGEIIAMGDSEIDIPMIEYAGLGIAMENAREAVLKSADYVTSSCEKDGVALAINKFVFGEVI